MDNAYAITELAARRERIGKALRLPSLVDVAKQGFSLADVEAYLRSHELGILHMMQGEFDMPEFLEELASTGMVSREIVDEFHHLQVNKAHGVSLTGLEARIADALPPTEASTLSESLGQPAPTPHQDHTMQQSVTPSPAEAAPPPAPPAAPQPEPVATSTRVARESDLLNSYDELQAAMAELNRKPTPQALDRAKGAYRHFFGGTAGDPHGAFTFAEQEDLDRLAKRMSVPTSELQTTLATLRAQTANDFKMKDALQAANNALKPQSRLAEALKLHPGGNALTPELIKMMEAVNYEALGIARHKNPKGELYTLSGDRLFRHPEVVAARKTLFNNALTKAGIANKEELLTAMLGHYERPATPGALARLGAAIRDGLGAANSRLRTAMTSAEDSWRSLISRFTRHETSVPLEVETADITVKAPQGTQHGVAAVEVERPTPAPAAVSAKRGRSGLLEAYDALEGCITELERTPTPALQKNAADALRHLFGGTARDPHGAFTFAVTDDLARLAEKMGVATSELMPKLAAMMTRTNGLIDEHHRAAGITPLLPEAHLNALVEQLRLGQEFGKLVVPVAPAAAAASVTTPPAAHPSHKVMTADVKRLLAAHHELQTAQESLRALVKETNGKSSFAALLGDTQLFTDEVNRQIEVRAAAIGGDPALARLKAIFVETKTDDAAIKAIHAMIKKKPDLRNIGLGIQNAESRIGRMQKTLETTIQTFDKTHGIGAAAKAVQAQAERLAAQLISSGESAHPLPASTQPQVTAPVAAPAQGANSIATTEHHLVSSPAAAKGIGANAALAPEGFAAASTPPAALHTKEYRADLPKTGLSMEQFEELQARAHNNAELALAAQGQHQRNALDRLFDARGQLSESGRPVVPISLAPVIPEATAVITDRSATAMHDLALDQLPQSTARAAPTSTSATPLEPHGVAEPISFTGGAAEPIPAHQPAPPLEAPAPAEPIVFEQHGAGSSAARSAESTVSHGGGASASAAEVEAKSWIKRIVETAKAHPKKSIAAGVAAAAGLGYVALHDSRKDAPTTEQSLQ